MNEELAARTKADKTQRMGDLLCDVLKVVSYHVQSVNIFLLTYLLHGAESFLRS